MHLVGSAHPLQFFVGRDESGHARVVIRGSVKPQMPNLSGLVHIERFEDQTRKWNLSLVLQVSKFEEVFLRLVDDMHSRTATAPNEAVATDRVSIVIDEWRRLLQARSMGLLSKDELRGLIGEMWLVLHWFTRDRSLEVSLEGWLGPLGLPQDFWFEQDGYHEAKSIGPATSAVKISSAEQLDPVDMQLLVLLIADTDESQVGAINLPVIASRLRSALIENGSSDKSLYDRLDHLGVDLAEPFYRDTWFVVSAVDAYRLTDRFPALRASSLPDGIGRVRYQLDLAAIEPFRSPRTEVN
jgi:hypothetical protein